MAVEDADHSMTDSATKAREKRTFYVLAILLAPAVTFILVASYGFAIWMSQILLGPPSA